MKTNSFLSQLNSSKSQKVQEALSNFLLDEFPMMKSKNDNQGEIARQIQDKITELIVQYAKVWKIDLNKDEKAYEEICNGFENIITKKIYNNIFCVTKEDKESDYNFEIQCDLFSFITPQHLEIEQKVLNDYYIKTAINSKIHLTKHP